MNLAKAQDGMGKPWWDFYLDQEVVSNVAKREPPEMTHNIRWLEKFIPDFWTDGKNLQILGIRKTVGLRIRQTPGNLSLLEIPGVMKKTTQTLHILREIPPKLPYTGIKFDPLKMCPMKNDPCNGCG